MIENKMQSPASQQGPDLAQLFTRDGAQIHLLNRIGRGGEGTLYRVADRDDLVAKIYHVLPGPTIQRKLRLMPLVGDFALKNSNGWPIQTLHVGRGGPIVGFLQPFFTGTHPLHQVYGPQSRSKLFPHADDQFLINSACNLAMSVSVVHEGDLVIGDLNPSNILVDDAAETHLIDCDGFQFRWDNELFGSGVAMAEYAAPEIHAKSLATLERTKQHDCFALAVLIYQLFHNGRHPYASGQHQTGEDGASLVGAISSGRHAFVTTDGHARSINFVQQDVETFDRMFKAAFRPPILGVTRRPSAFEWVQAIRSARQLHPKQSMDEQNLKQTYLEEVTAAVACIRSQRRTPSIPAIREISNLPAPAVRETKLGPIIDLVPIAAIKTKWRRSQQTRSLESELAWFCATQTYEETVRFSDYFRTLNELVAKVSAWESATEPTHTLAVTDPRSARHLAARLKLFPILDGSCADAARPFTRHLSMLQLRTAADISDEKLSDVQGFSAELALLLYRWRIDLERQIAGSLALAENGVASTEPLRIYLEREILMGVQRLQAEARRAAELEESAFNAMKTARLTISAIP